MLPRVNEVLVIRHVSNSEFHKVVKRHYKGEVGKTTVVYVKFICDVECQKLFKSANVSRS